MMKENMVITVLVFINLFWFFACSPGTETEKGFIFDERTFNAEWHEWQNHDIQNYSFTMTGKLPHWNFSRAILMYGYKVNIIVKNGIMDSFEYIGDVPYENHGVSILEPEFTSISDMYQKISDRAKDEKEWWEKYSDEGGFVSITFKIEYDPQLHYIRYFEPVTVVESGWILDTTNHAVSISNWAILP
jgi:hypothetical protein